MKKYITDREKEVVALVLKGMSNIEIADKLGIAPKTVTNHLSKVFKRYSLKRRTQLIAMSKNLKL